MLAPAASQEAIKELGTNGGGIVNANSAHPFENPSGGPNLLEIFLLLVIPVCMTRTFGVMVRNTRQGHVLVPSYGKETNYLRVYLAQLRRKLEPDPSRPRYLITEPGMGYRFET